MKKIGGVDENGDFVITVTYNTKSTWEMNELERVLADSETKATVKDYGENFVEVEFPRELRVSKKEDLDTDSLEDEDNASPDDEEEVNDTNTDQHEPVSEDTL